MTIGCFLPRTYFGNTGPRRSGRKGGRAACRPSQRQAAPTAAQDVRAAGEACPGQRGPVCHMAARLDAQLGARLVEPRLDVAHADALLEHRAEAAARHDAHLLLAVEDCAALARRRALGDDEAGPLARGCPEKRGEGGGGGLRAEQRREGSGREPAPRAVGAPPRRTRLVGDLAQDALRADEACGGPGGKSSSSGRPEASRGGRSEPAGRRGGALGCVGAPQAFGWSREADGARCSSTGDGTFHQRVGRRACGGSWPPPTTASPRRACPEPHHASVCVAGSRGGKVRRRLSARSCRPKGKSRVRAPGAAYEVLSSRSLPYRHSPASRRSESRAPSPTASTWTGAPAGWCRGAGAGGWGGWGGGWLEPPPPPRAAPAASPTDRPPRAWWRGKGELLALGAGGGGLLGPRRASRL